METMKAVGLLAPCRRFGGGPIDRAKRGPRSPYDRPFILIFAHTRFAI